MYKLIALDRDGVINQDSPSYIKSPEEWQAMPGSIVAIAKLCAHGYQVVVVTNQSGVARGIFSLDTLNNIHQKMLTQITAASGHIEQIFICPHLDQDNCSCRKPKPGLLLQALEQFSLNPEEMLIIGDSTRDLLAAKACGSPAIFIKSDRKTHDLIVARNAGVPIYDNLLAAVDSICNKI